MELQRSARFTEDRTLDPPEPVEPARPLLAPLPQPLRPHLHRRPAGPRDPARESAAAIGVDGFIALVRELGLRAIELDHRWLTPLTDAELRALARRLRGSSADLQFLAVASARRRRSSDAVRCYERGRREDPALPSDARARGRAGALGRAWHEHARSRARHAAAGDAIAWRRGTDAGDREPPGRRQRGAGRARRTSSVRTPASASIPAMRFPSARIPWRSRAAPRTGSATCT